MEKHRCVWSTHTELEKAYHDEAWGLPLHDDRGLFEMLCLEGMQAGLSWNTILAKREGYKEAFFNFDPEAICNAPQEYRETLVTNPAIVRHQGKINAIFTNAEAYKKVVTEYGSLDVFLWRYVDGKPIDNAFEKHEDVPAVSDLAIQLAKDLKKIGFKFLGPTTVYAFMQAVGMVNDHTTDCFRYTEVK